MQTLCHWPIIYLHFIIPELSQKSILSESDLHVDVLYEAVLYK